jgi:hypothetical protein
MTNSHLWIDEVDLSYWEPPADPLLEVFKGFGMSESWIEAESKDRARRTYAKLKRKKEMEHCLHGRRTFPVNWAPGTHPLGEHLFWVNIEGVHGGPYQLNESDHHILHSVGRKHEHVSETTIREDRRRAVEKMLSPKNSMPAR